jgi:Leucine-rich repeat (LRR) protein
VEHLSKQEIERLSEGSDLEMGVYKAISESNCKEFFKELKSTFNLKKLDKGVQKFIEETIYIKEIKGPLNFKGMGAAFKDFYTYYELFNMGSKDDYFPGILIATDFGGCYFFLMLESGKIVAMHHDDFPVCASNVVGKVYSGDFFMGSTLAAIMEAEYTLCKIDGLLGFQMDLKDYNNLLEISATKLVKAITKNFKISFNVLKKSLNKKSYYFLDIDEDVLDNMLLTEKNLKKTESSSEKIVNLSLNFLGEEKLNENILKCTELKDLDLSDNSGLNFEEAFTILSSLPKLERLVLSRNNFKELPCGIEKLTALKQLILSENQINKGSRNFEKLSKLILLDLRDNLLENGESYNIECMLPNTRILFKREKWVSSIQKDISLGDKSLYEEGNHGFPQNIELDKVKSIYFRKVTCIDEKIAMCKNLESIAISGDMNLKTSSLNIFPKAIEECKKLNKVILVDNPYIEVKEVIKELKKLPNLKSLVLNNIGGEFLEEEFAELTGLEELDFSNYNREFNYYNKPIADWDKTLKIICKLKNLKWLRIASNDMKNLPEELTLLTNLEYLDLSSNGKIENWEETLKVIAELTSLKGLKLGHCPFKKFPGEMKNLTNLRELLIDSVFDMDNVFKVAANYPKLEYLSMAQVYLSDFMRKHGKIKVPDSIGDIKSLRSINFFRNPGICSIPSTITKLTKLEELKITWCGLSKADQQELVKILPACNVMIG